MNQPQQLSVAHVFQGFLVCQMPRDVMEVELKIKTKWEKFPLHTDQHTRMEKYRTWKIASCCRIHSRRTLPCLEKPDEHQGSTDSGIFINSGQGLGYAPKTFIPSDTEEDIPPHIPDLEDFCSMCLTTKVRCTCKPMSDWSVDLIDITQLDPPNSDITANNDRDDGQDNVLPSDWSDQDNFWWDKAYDKVKPLSSLKPVPALQMEMRTVIGVNTFTHTITGLRPLCKCPPPNLPQVGPKALGPTITLLQWHHQGKQKTKVTSGYGLLKLLLPQKRPLKP